jgi:hypothetical protein
LFRAAHREGLLAKLEGIVGSEFVQWIIGEAIVRAHVKELPVVHDDDQLFCILRL